MIKYKKLVNFYDKKLHLITTEEKEKREFYTLEEAKKFMDNEELNYILNKNGTSVLESIELFHRIDNFNCRKYHKTRNIHTLDIEYLGLSNEIQN